MGGLAECSIVPSFEVPHAHSAVVRGRDKVFVLGRRGALQQLKGRDGGIVCIESQDQIVVRHNGVWDFYSTTREEGGQTREKVKKKKKKTNYFDRPSCQIFRDHRI